MEGERKGTLERSRYVGEISASDRDEQGGGRGCGGVRETALA